MQAARRLDSSRWSGRVGVRRAERPVRPGPGLQPVVHPYRRLDVDRVVMLDAALHRHERAGHHDRRRLAERQAGPGMPLI